MTRLVSLMEFPNGWDTDACRRAWSSARPIKSRSSTHSLTPAMTDSESDPLPFYNYLCQIEYLSGYPLSFGDWSRSTGEPLSAEQQSLIDDISRVLRKSRPSVAEVQFSPVLHPFFENRQCIGSWHEGQHHLGRYLLTCPSCAGFCLRDGEYLVAKHMN